MVYQWHSVPCNEPHYQLYCVKCHPHEDVLHRYAKSMRHGASFLVEVCHDHHIAVHHYYSVTHQTFLQGSEG